ncbi:MAG: CHAT domain-containing protein, partial [Symploca sp. SIO2E9]|nr:CHAT domain-containing protein [Symploca sp. SIO2E9]
QLQEWAYEYLKDYYLQQSHWRKQLNSRLSLLAEILHLDQIISGIAKTYTQVILIPHSYLHLFPLHALPLSSHSPNCLLDRFPDGVRYAPSCQLLQQLQPYNGKPLPHLFAIQNPTQDLPFTDAEVQTISRHFQPADILVREEASKTLFRQKAENLRAAHFAHFSCHGSFNIEKPLLSALLLADAFTTTDLSSEETNRYLPWREGKNYDLEECLTIAEIFNLDLSPCRLVTLSACETGLTDFGNTSDEYLSFASAFLYAGSSSVACSLWNVYDSSTALLMIKFYENLFNGSLDKLSIASENYSSIAIALNQAQLWLRDVSKKDFLPWFEQLPLTEKHRRSIEEYLSLFLPDAKPFEQPEHWAAFCAVGH